MVPTLSIYVAPKTVFATVISAGTKGARLDAVGVVHRKTSEQFPWQELRAQLESAQWDNVVLVLDTSEAAIASFPIEQDSPPIIIRELLELEVIQQFLSSPSEGYAADVYRIGPDAEGRWHACAVCRLRQHSQLLRSLEEALGVPVRLTTALIATIAGFEYNYPDYITRRIGIALFSEQTLDFAVVYNRSVLFWAWAPADHSPHSSLQRLIRQALFHCGELTTVFVAGPSLTRQLYEHFQTAFEGRFAEPPAPLDAFRMAECGLHQTLCSAVAPLGHLFAPAFGAALQQYYLSPDWTFSAEEEVPL
ncbi:MAG: hypothetical protein NZ606_04920 [Candidatus Kapabacteria bacterium]|nr:hypothetical protein [Candidatus Kapabacteria bacterium]